MNKCNLLSVILCGILMFFSCQSKQEENHWKLWYSEPAEKWIEALPVGNGRIGAMVFGNPAQEKIQLNEETLWAGQPNSNANPDALTAIPEVRKLMFEGKYKEAQKIVDEKIIPKTNHGMCYQPIGDLNLSFTGHEESDQYYRELDISSAITTTRYTVDGVEYTRETFASFTGQTIVVRLTASQKGMINFSAWLTSPQKSETVVEDNALFLRGISGDLEGLEGKVKFTTQVKILSDGGKRSSEQSKIIVSGANAATIYVAMATNFVNYHDISANPDERVKNYMQGALVKKYRELRNEHIAFYRRYFDRIQIDLGVTGAVKKPTNIRILEFAKTNDPQLAALYFQFGRYLLISSSQPGCQPANLQGIWNDLMLPPWDSKYTTNINAEMNYWPAELTNLSELHQPFIQMVKEVAVTGANTARVMYGTRG